MSMFSTNSPREVQGGDFVPCPKNPEEAQRRAAETAAWKPEEWNCPVLQWSGTNRPGLSEAQEAVAQALPKRTPKLTSSSSSSSTLSSLGL